MVCTGYDNLYALNRTTGEMLHSFSFGTQIVKLGNYTDSNAFMIFARDGALHYVNLERMTDYVGETFSQCNSTNVKTMELGDDYWLTLPYHEKQITLYRRAVSPKAEPLCTFSEQIREAKLNRDGSRLAVSLNRDDLMVDIVYEGMLHRYMLEDSRILKQDLGFEDLEESLCAGSGTAGKMYGFLKGRYDGGYLTTP